MVTGRSAVFSRHFLALALGGKKNGSKTGPGKKKLNHHQCAISVLMMFATPKLLCYV